MKGEKAPYTFLQKKWNTSSEGRLSDKEIKSVIVLKCFQIML